MRDHPKGLQCVPPLMEAVPALRSLGGKIVWVYVRLPTCVTRPHSRLHTASESCVHSNWGLTDHELTTLPPSLARGFMKGGKGGFGAPLPGEFGRLLMRGAYNSELYGPLQALYEQGKEAGTDVWVHKNRCVP